MSKAVSLMNKMLMLLGKTSVRGAIFVTAALTVLVALSLPAAAQRLREFRPIDRTDVYDRQFLDDFFDTLGYRPQGLTWIEESETVRLLVTAGVQSERGDPESALLTLGMIPDAIVAIFPFIATMHEDLLVPRILEPWYSNNEARQMLLTFYRDSWLPHPEYRDDYVTFRDDTMGRASRRDPAVPAVWILGHLADYGFVPDQALTEDDPYLFLWDLLVGLTYYSQRATYYELQWDSYNEADYKRAVVRRVAEIVRAAHDEAARRETARGFWADLISSHHPFETPTTGVESTGVVAPAEVREPTSQPGPTQPAYAPVSETVRSDLFRTPTEQELQEKAAAIERRIEDLVERVEASTPAPPPTVAEVPAVEEVAGPEIEPVAPPAEEGIPDEFRVPAATARTPSELAPESGPPAELGNYALVRLEEIADQLAADIGVLANELGQETIQLVVLYNDVNVSEETVVNAEDRYIAKREAFLAGLAVWDRFDMEIYSPLALADFNDLVVNDLMAPLEQLKAGPTQWAQYRAFEAHFDEAFGQIENGVRNRRDEPDVLAAEAAALTAFLGEYNTLIKEIEDLLSGAVTEPSTPEG